MFAKIPNIDHPIIYILISEKGVKRPTNKNRIPCVDLIKVFFFMVNAEEKPRQQLRMPGGILDIAERDHFVKDMLSFKSEQPVIEYLLHDKRYISIPLIKNSPAGEFIDKRLMDIQLPGNVLVVFIERNNNTFAPNGKSVLLENDTITVVGEPHSINQMYDRFFLDKK